MMLGDVPFPTPSVDASNEEYEKVISGLMIDCAKS